MAWLAALNVRAKQWPLPARWAFRVVAGCLAVFGAALWITLWFDRSPLLGMLQFVLCAWVFWTEVIAPWRRR